MSFLSPLPGSSAPAYCDIVPLFSQSIAFNRTGAHWPNWKGLRPAFHQSHQSMAQGPRAQGGMEEVCGVSSCCTYSLMISCSLYTSSLFLSIFLCLIFWCHLMAVETLCRKWVFCFPSIHFSISMQKFLLIARENENQQQSQRKMSSFSICLPHTFEICHVRVLSLFKFASSILFWQAEFERTLLSNEKTPLCVF